MGNCSDNIKTICSKKTNLKCTKYTGDISDKSDLDPNDCHSGHNVLEDIYKQLDELFENLDFSTLGNTCLEYEGEDTSEYLENILFKFEEAICELKDAVSKKGLDLTDLDTKCLKDACDQSPTELLEVLQLIIDRVCETSEATNCECCTECLVYQYKTEGSIALADTIEEPIQLTDSSNTLIEFIATSTARYRVSWTGEIYDTDTTGSGDTIIKFGVYQGTGSQAGLWNGVQVPYIGNLDFLCTHLNSLNEPSEKRSFQIEFDIVLNAGESVGIGGLTDGDGVVGANLFIVDKLCLPTIQN